MLLLRLFAELAHREGEVCVGERFVAWRKVPPFAVEGLEAMAQHGLTQNHTVVELFGSNLPPSRALAVVASVLASLGISAEVGMAFWSEPVERAAHVEFLFCCHVEQCEVDGRTACVSALFVYVFLLKKHALVEVGVEVAFHHCVGNVLCPTHEVVDAFLRTVGIVYF